MKTAKYLFVTLLLLLIPTVCFAQKKKLKVEKPDLAKIKAETQDPNSEFYYPRLWKLYNANDTVMTPEQFRYLYFGSMYQEDYNPYRKSDYSDKTDSLLNLNRAATQRRDSTFKAYQDQKLGAFELKRRYDKAKQHTIREQQEIVRLGELALMDNPFDLQSLYMVSRLYRDMGKSMKATITDFRLENLLGAIISSGTGKTEDDAYVVVSPDHEYFLLEVLGYDVDDYEFKEPGYDYLAVHPIDASAIPSSKTPAGFYFDVQPLIEQYTIKFPENTDEAPIPEGQEILIE